MIGDWAWPVTTIFVLAVLICTLSILVDRQRLRLSHPAGPSAREAHPAAHRAGGGEAPAA